MASASNFLSRQEFIEQKKVEEARKEGKMAPAKDEEGHDINPHMPLYITQAPWYLKQDQRNRDVIDVGNTCCGATTRDISASGEYDEPETV